MSEKTSVIIIRAPADTPAGAPLFIAGDFNGWSPGHPLSRLKSAPDGTFRFDLPNDLERAEFKFTRGSWDSVECSAQGKQIDNRVWTSDHSNGTLTLQIGGWCDVHPAAAAWRPTHTVVGDLRVIRDIFSPQLGSIRDIYVWLPPEYDARKSERYPVLYLHDGQNLFDEVEAYNHEWGVDEVSTELAERENLRHIVVGIPNMGLSRMHEYSPWEDDFRRSRGWGERYVRFIVQTIKPQIDAQYRTLPARECTAVGGSSLGGLISLYAGLTRPDVFSTALCLSPSMNIAGGRILKLATTFSSDVRFWLDYGEREFGGFRGLSEQMIEAVRECGRLLNSNGARARVLIDPEGEHDEASWRKRLPDILRWWHERLPK